MLPCVRELTLEYDDEEEEDGEDDDASRGDKKIIESLDSSSARSSGDLISTFICRYSFDVYEKQT